MRLEDLFNRKKADHIKQIREAESYFRETIEQTIQTQPIVAADFASQLYRFMLDCPQVFSEEEKMRAASQAANLYRKIHDPIKTASYECDAEEHEEKIIKRPENKDYPILDPNPIPR